MMSVERDAIRLHQALGEDNLYPGPFNSLPDRIKNQFLAMAADVFGAHHAANPSVCACGETLPCQTGLLLDRVSKWSGPWRYKRAE